MIVFSNPGVIDVRGITTFGVNAKDSNRNPIGYFGTGLKFAIATLLRNDCQIEIYAGATQYTFSLRADTVRAKEFRFVHMDISTPPSAEELAVNPDARPITEGYDLAYTADLGRNWKMWQAYRELYCNCVTDEGGIVDCVPDETPFGVSPDHTVIVVRGEAFENEHKVRDSFILSPDRKPRFVVPGVVEVYDGASQSVFYRGIRVGDVPEGGARYTYNIIGWLYLTEDRTMGLTSQFTDAVAQAVTSGLDEAFSEDVLTIVGPGGQERKGVETKLDFTSTTFTERLFGMAKRLIEDTKRKVNRTIYNGVRSYERENLLSRRIDLGADEAKRLNDALADCRRIGLPWDKEVGAVADLGAGVKVTGSEDAILLHIDLWDDFAEMRAVLALQIAKLIYKSVADADIGTTLIDHMFSTWPARVPAEAAVDAEPTDAAPDAPADSKVWLLVGVWSGYNSLQTKVVHREIVDERRVERLKNLRRIIYTDGTDLSITISEEILMDAKAFKQQLGYKNLIEEAERSGKSTFRIGTDDRIDDQPASAPVEPPAPGVLVDDEIPF